MQKPVIPIKPMKTNPRIVPSEAANEAKVNREPFLTRNDLKTGSVPTFAAMAWIFILQAPKLAGSDRQPTSWIPTHFSRRHARATFTVEPNL